MTATETSSPKLIIRTSDRGMFKGCRRKWDFGSKIRQNWEPQVTAKPLEFGTAFHKGMEGYYMPELWHDPKTRQELAISMFIAETEVHKKRYLELVNKDGLDIDVEADFKERLELGIGMYQNYFTWAPSRDKLWTPKMVEIEFEVPVMNHGEPLYMSNPMTDDSGLPVVYQGRIDLLIEDEDGYYWIVDHKTAGQFGSSEHLDLDEQCGSYAWALQKMLGLPIRGVIYNECLKAVPHAPLELKNGGFSKNKQQRTTYALYKATLEQNGCYMPDYQEFLDYLQEQGNPFFRRHQVHRSQTELKNLEQQIADEALDMLDPNLRIYPNPGRFNCMGCAFRAPCLAMNDGSDHEYMLRISYKKRPDETQTELVDESKVVEL